MQDCLDTRGNPLRRTRSIQVTVFFLLAGLAALSLSFELFAAGGAAALWRVLHASAIVLYVVFGTVAITRRIAQPVPSLDKPVQNEARPLDPDFVSLVAHQLRTPLTGMRWTLELAQDAASPEEMQSLVADAHASTRRLITLVNDMLDVTRLEAGSLATAPQPLSLEAVAADVARELAGAAAAKHQTLTVTGRASHVMADAQLTRLATWNLISNAIKYTPEGGTVHVFIEANFANVRLHVRDTGIGISDAAQHRIFEKFFRAEDGLGNDTDGIGLGLYLVRLIAERSAGTITCQSIEGAGSTFILSLPLAEPQRAAA